MMGIAGSHTPNKGYDQKNRITKKITLIETIPVMQVIDYGVAVEDIPSLFQDYTEVIAVHFSDQVDKGLPSHKVWFDFDAHIAELCCLPLVNPL